MIDGDVCIVCMQEVYSRLLALVTMTMLSDHSDRDRNVSSHRSPLHVKHYSAATFVFLFCCTSFVSQR